MLETPDNLKATGGIAFVASERRFAKRVHASDTMNARDMGKKPAEVFSNRFGGRDSGTTLDAGKMSEDVGSLTAARIAFDPAMSNIARTVFLQ